MQTQHWGASTSGALWKPIHPIPTLSFSWGCVLWKWDLMRLPLNWWTRATGPRNFRVHSFCQLSFRVAELLFSGFRLHCNLIVSSFLVPSDFSVEACFWILISGLRMWILAEGWGKVLVVGIAASGQDQVEWPSELLTDIHGLKIFQAVSMKSCQHADVGICRIQHCCRNLGVAYLRQACHAEDHHKAQDNRRLQSGYNLTNLEKR